MIRRFFSCGSWAAWLRVGEARVIPRMTHPESTITRPHHRFTLKPRSPSVCCPEVNIPARTSVTPKSRTMAEI